MTTGNSVAQSFWTPAVLTVRPDLAAANLPVSVAGTNPDGVWAAAGTPPGILTQNRVMLMPYSDGSAGTQFSIRLWGFSVHNTDNPSWIPLFLAEILCTTAAIPGVTTPTAADPLGYSFPINLNLCDTISLTQGTLGPTGEINSTGPGTNIPAWATIELKGSQWLFWDFQSLDGAGSPPVTPFGMNTFWRFV